MKIIKVGKPNGWWGKRKPICLTCKTKLELHERDIPAWTEEVPHVIACFVCPNCGSDVQVIKA